jgi:5-hydroxyisourate hydrolase
MSAITTHVLDSGAGRPAAGVEVILEYRAPSGEWKLLGKSVTDAGGRARDLLPEMHVLEPGLYALRFDTSSYSQFFPEVMLRFQVDDPRQHYHVPLLLSAHSYTTYRGS